MIYLDHAATTRTLPEVAEAMAPYQDIYYGNPSTIYEFGEKSRDAIERARELIARTIHARPEEIFFTSGGTESDNWALKEAVHLYERTHGGKKGHILTTPVEHHAILNSCEELKQMGCGVTYLNVDESARVILADIENRMQENTCMFSVMYANNEIGTIEPIDELGRMAKKHKLIFHTDAVQAYGHLPIHVQRENIDMLSASAHKFGGPKGVGFLYIRSEINLPAFIHGGGQENSMRSGTENVPAIMGMAAALEEACAHMAENTQKMSALRNRLIAGLSQIPDAVLNGDPENRLPGNVNFSFEGIEGESLVLLLDQHGICASTGSACTAQSLSPSHVLLAIGRSHEAATGALRLSLSEDNTQADVDEVLLIVPGLVRELRGKRVRNPFQRPL